MKNAPHFEDAWRYARDTWDDKGIEELQRLGCRRFLDDLESGRWDFSPAIPEFCIETMTGLFSFSQGERMDGTPLRGAPFELMPWHIYCTYAIGGFLQKGTTLRRFTEADIFAPRKTVKTTFGEALQTTLALWYRMSGAKAKTVAGSLKQGLEGFDWLVYNFQRLGLVAPNNPPGKLKLLNSSLGHSIEGEIWGGFIDLETLAFKPELFDSFNASFVHLDELELYKNAIPYTRLRDGMKAFSNKLLLCTFTAGDDGNGFAASHRDYMERILRGTVTGPAAPSSSWHRPRWSRTGPSTTSTPQCTGRPTPPTGSRSDRKTCWPTPSRRSTTRRPGRSSSPAASTASWDPTRPGSTLRSSAGRMAGTTGARRRPLSWSRPGSAARTSPSSTT